MDPINFNVLNKVLSVEHLSDLTLDKNDQIIRKGINEPPSEKEIVERIKKQFMTAIVEPQLINISSEPLKSDGLQLSTEIRQLEQINDQVNFITNLAKSKIAAEFFNETEMPSLLKERNEALEKGLDLLVRKLELYTQSFDVSSHQEASQYKAVLKDLTKENLRDRVDVSYDVMAYKIRFAKQIPDLKKQLSVLPEQDYPLLPQALAVGDNWLDSDRDLCGELALFIETCQQINRFNNKQLQENLKACIFSVSCEKKNGLPWKGLRELAAFEKGEVVLKELMDLVTSDSTSERQQCLAWVVQLLYCTQGRGDEERLDKIAELVKDLHIYRQNHHAIPRFDKKVSLFSQISLLKNYDALYHFCGQGARNSILGIASALPDKIQKLTAWVREADKDTQKLFHSAMDSLEYPGDRFELLSILHTTQQGKRDELLNALIAWDQHGGFTGTTWPILFFQQGSIEKILSAMGTMLEIAKPFLRKSSKDFKEKLQSVNSQLFGSFFNREEEPDFWKIRERQFENHSKLEKPFKEWLIKFSWLRGKDNQSLTEIMSQASPAFKKKLARLFDLEKSSPELFERILKVIIEGDSPNLLGVLVTFNMQYGLGNLIALLKFLETKPKLSSTVGALFKIDEHGEINPYGYAGQLAALLDQMDVDILEFILKEFAVPRKASEMLHTYSRFPQKLRSIIEIEISSLTPIIWNDRSSHPYLHYDERKSSLIEKYPSLKEAIQQKGWQSISWSEIPDEIWDMDAALPLSLMQLRADLKGTQSIRFLLQDAVKEGKKALAYKILELQKENSLINYLYNLFALCSPQDDTSKVLAELCLKNEVKLMGPLPFLKHESRTDFSSTLAILEELYSLSSEGTIEERLQKLPINWKWILSSSILLCRDNPELFSILCIFIQKQPKAPLLNLLFQNFDASESLLTTFSQEDLKRYIQSLTRILDKHPVALDDKFESNLYYYARIFKKLSKDFNDQALDFIHAYLLAIPSKLISMTCTVYRGDQSNGKRKKFMEMIEMDMKLGQPYGNFISCFETLQPLLENDPIIVKAAKNGIFSNSNVGFTFPEALDQLGALYPKLLVSDLYHQKISKLLKAPECIQALKSISLDRLSHPQRFLSRVLAIASWNQPKSLEILLKWTGKNVQGRGEDLLDMAYAGYLSEAVDIVTRLDKDPNDKQAKLLLEKAGSKEALSIQLELSGKQAPLFRQEQTNAFVTSQELSELITQIKQFAIKVGEKDLEKQVVANIIQTECATAIAKTMLTESGKLRFLTTEQLDQLLTEIGISTTNDGAVYLKTTSIHLASDSFFSDEFAFVKMCKEINSPAGQIIRRMLNLNKDETISDQYARIAILSALLSRPRQSDLVGSCYATSWMIITQSDSEGLKLSFAAYKELISSNALKRKVFGKHAGDRSYPICLFPKAMAASFLVDNLLLRARENALSSMGAGGKGNKQLIPENLVLFDKDHFFDKAMVAMQDSFIEGKFPISKEAILAGVKKTFLGLVKTVVEFEEKHLLTGKVGWSYLARRDKEVKILDGQSYIKLHRDILELACDQLLQSEKEPTTRKYLEAVFRHLQRTTELPYFLSELNRGYVGTDGSIMNLWSMDSGGSGIKVIATDLQFDSEEILALKYPGKTVESLLEMLMQFCDALPEVEREKFIKDPEKLSYLQIPGHGLGFKPASLISQHQKGKTADDIINLLNEPSGIRLTDIDQEKRRSWMTEWIETSMAINLQKPFAKAISSIEWEKLTLEDFGRVMMQTYLQVSCVKPSYDEFLIMERQFFKLISREDQKKLPIQIIGDLNWDSSNIYLSCARSPLTGKLEWYRCSREGEERTPVHRNLMIDDNPWILFSPISRKDSEGSLSIK